MPLITRAAIFCGDTEWKWAAVVEKVLASLPMETAIISGGAQGADIMAEHAARRRGMRTIVLDAPWGAYGNRAGPIRNQWMLDVLLMFADGGADIEAHAFHSNIAKSKGTADMLGRLKKAAVRYTIHTGES